MTFQNRRNSFAAGNREQRHQIMLSNRFNPLANYDDDESAMDLQDPESSTNGASAKENVEVKVKKPPPIEIFGKKLSEIKQKISSTTGVTCEVQYRLTVLKSDRGVRETIKVYTQNDDDYKAIKQMCETEKLQFHTHPLPGERRVKICLYGLCDMKVDDIKSELKKYFNTPPADIKTILPRNGHTGESRIYVLYFRKSDAVKVSDLRATVTGLFNLRVRFEYFSPRKFGPTQCSNCQDYGHGAENCFHSPRCVRCGGSHQSKACVHLVKPVNSLPEGPSHRPKIPENLVKCANCNERHTANYTKCSYRLNVIQKQQRTRQVVRQVKGFVADHDDFPSLPRRPAAEPVVNRAWGAAQALPKHDGDQQQQLFSMQTNMMSMMNEMMTKLSEMIKLVSQLTDKMLQAKDVN